MVTSLLARVGSRPGFLSNSPETPNPISPTILLPDDDRGQITDYALIELQNPSVLRVRRPATATGEFAYAMPGARYRFQTNATQVFFSVSSNNFIPRYDARNYTMSVLVNGTEVAAFDSRDGGYTLNLVGATSRLIELVWPYADGVDLLKVEINSGATFTTPAARPTGIIACAGDSITQGFTATKTTTSWPYKLAVLKNRRLINLGDGGDVAEADFAAGLIGTGADRVTYMIGYNNFGAQTALATFQAEVEGWINAAEAALPSAKIYVISPLYSPNSNTLTLAQYRTAVVAAVTAAGGPNVAYVNGLSLMTNNNDRLVDTIHPNDLGSGEIATALAAIIAP